MVTKHILVVDDMAVVRELITRSLRTGGFNVTTAASAQEAIGLLKETNPDLLLLDVAMPEMDGLLLLRAIRSDATLPQPPAILLTALDARDVVMHDQELDVRHILSKHDFSFEELFMRINEVLQEEDSAQQESGRG